MGLLTTSLVQNEKRIRNENKQVTRGHNIIADGWAGASNPHPHPRPPHTHSHTHTIAPAASKMRVFAFSTRSSRTDRRTDGPTDRRTDGRTDGRTKSLIELRVRN